MRYAYETILLVHFRSISNNGHVTFHFLTLSSALSIFNILLPSSFLFYSYDRGEGLAGEPESVATPWISLNPLADMISYS